MTFEHAQGKVVHGGEECRIVKKTRFNSLFQLQNNIFGYKNDILP